MGNCIHSFFQRSLPFLSIYPVLNNKPASDSVRFHNTAHAIKHTLAHTPAITCASLFTHCMLRPTLFTLLPSVINCKTCKMKNDWWVTDKRLQSEQVYIRLCVHSCVCWCKVNQWGRESAISAAQCPHTVWETINTSTSPVFVRQGQVGRDYSTAPRSTSPWKRVSEMEKLAGREWGGEGVASENELASDFLSGWCEICAGKISCLWRSRRPEGRCGEIREVCDLCAPFCEPKWVSEKVKCTSESEWERRCSFQAIQAVYIPENWCTGESRIHFPEALGSR